MHGPSRRGLQARADDGAPSCGRRVHEHRRDARRAAGVAGRRRRAVRARVDRQGRRADLGHGRDEATGGAGRGGRWLADPDRPYVSVRFGNVLGSSGSVVPLFQRQLREGVPLTITDPEMTRYFMTIPEAARLILEASLHRRAGRPVRARHGRPDPDRRPRAGPGATCRARSRIRCRSSTSACGQARSSTNRCSTTPRRSSQRATRRSCGRRNRVDLAPGVMRTARSARRRSRSRATTRPPGWRSSRRWRHCRCDSDDSTAFDD